MPDPPEESEDVDVDVLDRGDAHSRATRGGAMRAGGYLIGLLVSAGSAALVFRHLGKVGSGLYVTGTSLVAIVATFSDLGLTAVGLRELAVRSGEARWALARNLLGLRLTVTVPAGIVVTAIAWICYSRTLGEGVALAALGLALTVTGDNASLPLSLELRLGSQALLDLTRQLMSVLCMVAFVIVGGGVIGFLSVPVPVGVVALGLTLVLVGWRRRPLRPRFELTVWRAFLRPMLPYTVALAAAALYLRAALLLVSALASADKLGYFSLSFRIVEAATPIPGLLIGSVLPVLVRAAGGGGGDTLDPALRRLHELYLLVGAWVAVSVAVGAPLAVSVIGGHRFAPAAPVLALQGITLGAMFVSSVWGYGLISLGRYREILLINTGGLVANVTLVVALYELDGLAGAALATGIVEIAMAVTQAAAVLRIRRGLSFPFRGLLPAALAAACGLAPLALAPLGVPVLARLVLSSLLFAAVLAMLRAVPPEIVAVLGRTRRSQAEVAPR